jgi:hypothetical protein
MFLQALVDAGMNYYDISTHSWRKGSASAAAGGSTCAPPIISICLRAGWKVSKILATYLSMENAADFFLGRVCAGLPMTGKEFGVLPPAWKRNLSPEDYCFILKMFHIVFPNAGRWGDNMRPILRHLLATLVFHKDYLQSLPQEHPWRGTYLGQHPEDLTRLHTMVELRYDGDSPEDRYIRHLKIRHT